MKECLHCNKEFEPIQPTKKFCSTSCRVMYNRKHGKKGEIKQFQLQAMYNEIMGAINKLNETKGQPPTMGIISQPLQEMTMTVKRNPILRSAEQWQELKRACESVEEWNEVKQQLMDAQNISTKQKELIIKTP